MATTYYTWDPLTDNVLMESDENGATTAVYTHKPERYGKLISQHRDGATSYYHYDGQGSTRQLTDENGDVTDSATYTAFGETVAKTGATTNPFGYKGAVGYYANPETEDLYVRARTYMPDLGRWLSVDPLGIEIDPNQYLFVANNPRMRLDPSGLQAMTWPAETHLRASQSGQTPNPTTITITPLRTTGGSRCQQFGSPTNFTMNNAPCDGYLAQLLLWVCFIKDCCCQQPEWKYKNLNFDYPSAESVLAFEVFKPKINKGQTGTLKTPDVFGTGPLQGTCGLINIAGLVVFICESDLHEVLNVGSPLAINRLSEGGKTKRCGIEHKTNQWTWMTRGTVDALWRRAQHFGDPVHRLQRQWRCCDMDQEKNSDWIYVWPTPPDSAK